MNAMPSKLHSGSIFVCMRVCQSILHATLVRFFELLGWVGSVRFGRWFSFARSLARSFSRRLRRGSKKQSRKHALMQASSCFFSCFFSSFLLPRFRRDFKHAFSHFSVAGVYGPRQHHHRVRSQQQGDVHKVVQLLPESCAAAASREGVWPGGRVVLMRW